MRVKIERRWDGNEWETYRESVDLGDVRVGESGHLVKSIFEGEPTGASLTVRGFVLNGGSEYRYTVLPDPVKRKVVRVTYATGTHADIDLPLNIMHNGVDVSRFFDRTNAFVGDYVETTVQMAGGPPVTFRFELVEIEADE